ncbi:OmpH family outer membrane protein [Candidatus Pelagibacter sp.]|nr:OmpH family outer membrane protein [Candidatus Pelagibacter sp.]
MKVNSKIILISLLLLITVNLRSTAEELNIVFVDMDKIISTSNAGKKIQNSLDKFGKKENEKFIKIESNLKKKEQEILKQKNIISKEEFDKNVKSFQEELLKLRESKVKFNRSIIEKNKAATNQMVNEINKILTKYAADNAISLVIQKKNIIIGKSNLDITPIILKEFNNKVKSID